MAVTYVDLKGWTLVFADTAVGLTTPAISPTCQITDVILTPATTSVTTDPTLCDDGTSVITGVQWTLDLIWYADLTKTGTAPDLSFSWYLMDNMLDWKYFLLTMGTAPDPVGGTFTGESQMVPGTVGGNRGAGFITSPASLPVRGLTWTNPGGSLLAADAGSGRAAKS